jgi:hypothetical protein
MADSVDDKIRQQRNYLLRCVDGPEGISIYTSEHEGVSDWCNSHPAMYVEVCNWRAISVFGPFDLRSMFDQVVAKTQGYQAVAPCGHTLNFQIGDDHGHFTCTVCRMDAAEKQNRILSAEMADLRAELERAREDVKRLDWLDNKRYCDDDSFHSRDAIDAAMRAMAERSGQ